MPSSEAREHRAGGLPARATDGEGSRRERLGFTRQQLKPLLSVEKRQDLLTLADLLATGQVTPVIDRTYHLDEAADALRYLGASHTRGKVVVTV